MWKICSRQNHNPFTKRSQLHVRKPSRHDNNPSSSASISMWEKRFNHHNTLFEKRWKKLLTQMARMWYYLTRRWYSGPHKNCSGKCRKLFFKILSKNHLTKQNECGKIIKSLEERWFFENWTVQRTNQADVRGIYTEQFFEQETRQQIRAKRTIYHGEFDPGSGRTLAACLTHASRTRGREKLASFWI